MSSVHQVLLTNTRPLTPLSQPDSSGQDYQHFLTWQKRIWDHLLRSAKTNVHIRRTQRRARRHTCVIQSREKWARQEKYFRHALSALLLLNVCQILEEEELHQLLS
jgi:hypothetical protein